MNIKNEEQCRSIALDAVLTMLFLFLGSGALRLSDKPRSSRSAHQPGRFVLLCAWVWVCLSMHLCLSPYLGFSIPFSLLVLSLHNLFKWWNILEISVCMQVSDGAELIKINKRFFMQHAQNNTMLRVETMVRSSLSPVSCVISSLGMTGERLCPAGAVNLFWRWAWWFEFELF